MFFGGHVLLWTTLFSITPLTITHIFIETEFTFANLIVVVVLVTNTLAASEAILSLPAIKNLLDNLNGLITPLRIDTTTLRSIKARRRIVV
jgi:hypothetical protein